MPTVFPSSLYIECMPKLDTIAQKFPEVYLIYMCTLSDAFGFEGRQPATYPQPRKCSTTYI